MRRPTNLSRISVSLFLLGSCNTTRLKQIYIITYNFLFERLNVILYILHDVLIPNEINVVLVSMSVSRKFFNVLCSCLLLLRCVDISLAQQFLLKKDKKNGN